MKQSGLAASYCCKKLGWGIIHCTEQGSMRGVMEIHDGIMELLHNECVI